MVGEGSAKKIEAISGSLFLLWIGIAWLMSLGPNIGSIGIGVIILGAQATKKYFGLKLEGFWLVVGAFFVVSGLGILSGVNIPLIPIILIVLGGKFLYSALKEKK